MSRIGEYIKKNKRGAAALAIIMLLIVGAVIFSTGKKNSFSGKSGPDSKGSEDKPALMEEDEEPVRSYSRALAARNQEYKAGDEKLVLTEAGKKLPSTKKDYTIMIYMTGSNLESRFGAASSDLKEIMESGYDSDRINVVVYTGGSRRWNGGIPSTQNNVMDMGLPEDKRIVADTEKCSDMGSPATLAEYINFCSNYYPADHYGLICWDHGGGPLWGYGSDELFNNDTLLLSEIRTAMEKTEFAKGRKLDWMGFDACLMGSVESASLWQNYASYLIASEEVEAGDGWCYDFLKTLNESNDAEEICQSIVDSYGRFYEENKTQFSNPDATLAVIDLSKVDDLEKSLNTLFTKMHDGMEKGDYARVSKFRKKAKCFGLSAVESRGEGYDLIDIGSLADQFQSIFPEETGRVREALASAVVSQTSNVKDTSGLSIYLPGDNQNLYKEVGKDMMKESPDGYKAFVEAYSDSWMDKSKVNWAFGEFKDGQEEITLPLSTDQLAEIEGAYYAVLEKSGNAGYRMTLCWVEIQPDENGILHIPQNPDLITAETDQITARSPFGFRQIQDNGDQKRYRTINCYLTPSQEFMDINADKDLRADVIVSMDKEKKMSIDQVSQQEDQIGLSGKNSVNVEHYRSIVDGSGVLLVPTRNDDGSMKAFYEWDRSGYLFSADPLEKEFHFVSRKASWFGGDYSCQVILQDVYGDLHCSDIHSLTAEDNRKTALVKTKKGEMTFRLSQDEAELIRYEGKDIELEIPDYVEKLPVTGIGTGIFSDSSTDTVTGIICPGTLRSIDIRAFQGCSKLTEIKLNEGLEEIGYHAFSRCGLKELHLPSTLKVLGQAAFEGNSFETVEIPAALTYIGSIPFHECASLREIKVSGKSSAVCDIDGVLFSADKKMLIQYPPARGREYKVSDGTEEIGYGAFGDSGVTKIVFPQSLKKIDNCAFFGCESMETPVLPDQLEEIGDLAFGSINFTSDLETRPVREELFIPARVSYIGDRCFGCISLSGIKVDEKNPYYASSGGFLTNKEKETILEAPLGIYKNTNGLITIPDGIIGFEKDLFEEFPEKAGFILPDSLFRIPPEVFPCTYGERQENGLAETIYEITIYCSEGSAAETYAKKYNIQCKRPPSKGDIYQGQIEQKTEDGGLMTFDLFGDHAALVNYKGGARKLTVPDQVENLPVTIIGNGKDPVRHEEESDGEEMEDLEDFDDFGDPEDLLNEDDFSAEEEFDDNLEELVLPATVSTIADHALELNLKEISVDKTSKKLKSIDGVLFTADGKELLCFPQDKIDWGSEDSTYTVPDGVEIISKNAFYASWITEITLPDSVKTIKKEAFASCSELEKVNPGKGLQSIEESAFSMSQIKEIAFPESLRTIGKEAFYFCHLSEIVLPDGLEKVGSQAFAYNEEVGKIRLPDSLKDIGEGAFMLSDDREDPKKTGVIKIPDSLEKLGRHAFTGVNTEGFTADESSKYFTAKDGLLLSKDGKTLWACPWGGPEEIHIPDTVIEIKEYAVGYGGSVKNVYIPDSVVRIADAAFEGKSEERGFSISQTIHCSKGSAAAEYAEGNGYSWEEK